MKNHNEYIGEKTVVYGTCHSELHTCTRLVEFERTVLYVLHRFSIGSGDLLFDDYMWHVMMWFDKESEQWR